MGFGWNFPFWNGSKYPFTTMQQLNLDWLISEVKQQHITIEEFHSQLQNMGVTIEECRNYITHFNEVVEQTALALMPSAIDNAITNGDFDNLIQKAQGKRIVIISDSYGEGATPDGQNESFITTMQRNLNLTNSDYFAFSQSGLAFYHEEDNYWAVDTLIKSNLNNVSNKNTITDFIIALGYNDQGSTLEQDITDGIIRTNRIIKNNFTNPNLKIHLFSLGYNCANEEIRGKLSYIYRKIYARTIGWNYYNMTPALCNSNLFSSDGFHPNQDGQNQITKQMLPMLNGGRTLGTCIAEETTEIVSGNTRIYSVLYPDIIKANIIGSYLNYETPITLDATNETNLFTVHSVLPLASPHTVNDREYFNIKAVAKYTENETVKYEECNINFYITQTAREVYTAKARLFNLTNDGIPYNTIENIDTIYFPSNSLSMNIHY